MGTIFLFEWRKLIRNRLSIVLLLFFAGLGIYSIYYGNNIIKKQIIELNKLETAYKEQINASLIGFQADTTTQKGKSDYERASDPTMLDYYVNPIAAFYPNTFSSMAIGQREVLPLYKEVSTNSGFLQVYDADISNPEALAAGDFDLSFVIIYLLPLLIIALSYNVVAEEKERGTYILLKSHSSRLQSIITYKLLFRVVIVLGLTYILNLVAIYTSPMNVSTKGIHLLHWLMVVTAYLLFWFAVCYLLIALQKNAITTALYMVGTWLFLSIIVPSLFSFYIDTSYPIGIKADVASEKRKIEEEVWEINHNVLIEQFYTDYPEYKTDKQIDTTEYSAIRFIAYYDAVEKELSPMFEVHDEKMKARTQLMSSLSEFVPAMKTQKLLNQIGYSDLQSFRNFDASAKAFQKKWRAFIFAYVFNAQSLTEKDYSIMPKHTLSGLLGQHKNMLIETLKLIVVVILLLLAQFYISNKQNTYQ